MLQTQLNHFPLQKATDLAAPPPVAGFAVASPRAATRTRIIEIIGSPGAGKSTLYNELIRHWDPQSSWEYTRNASKGNSLEKFVRALTGKKAKDPLVIEGGLDFVSHYPELANFLWSHLSDNRTYNDTENNKRFRSAYFLFRDFCRFQAIIQRDSPRLFVLDEGLLQRSFFINSDRKLMEETVSTYIDLIPLPAAVIYLEARNLDVIFARLKNRKKTIASHIGLTDWELYKDLETWQYLFTIITERLARKNVEIFRIDAEEPIDTNIALIEDHLHSLGNTPNASDF